MPEIHTVFVQTEAPKGNFQGRVVEGKYIVEDGVLTLTNRRGDLVRDAEGKSYTQKLNPGDNAKQIAGLLNKKNLPKPGEAIMHRRAALAVRSTIQR
jgi:hypothetical protein